MPDTDREQDLREAASLTRKIHRRQQDVVSLSARRAAVVARLRAQAVTHREIAERMGVTEQIVLKIMSAHRQQESA